METFYQSNIADFSLRLSSLNKRLNLFVFLRLAAFLLFIGSLVFLSLAANGMPAWILMATSITSFLFIVKYHLKLQADKTYIEKIIQINENELLYLKNDYTSFDNGEVYSEPRHPFAGDLNILGHASVFQYLNRTVTSSGKQQVIQYLLHPSSNKQDIEKAQAICRDLTPKAGWRQRFQALGADISDKNDELQSFHEWLGQDPVFLKNKFLLITINCLPVLAFGALIAGYFYDNYLFAKLAFFIQIILSLAYVKKINKIHAQLDRQFATLNSYADLMHHIANEKFDSPELLNAQQLISKNKDNASGQMKSLAGILNTLDRRMNVLAAFFLNTAYMADLRSIIRLEKWKVENRLHVDDWLESIAIFDKGISFATFAFNNPDFIFPTISDEIVIEAQNLGHPLIPSSKRICNDFSIKKESEFVILTGANMAGKSTFLRTAGVNLVLAMNGTPVCATEFTFKPLKIMTSISVKDSLFENESYFYAELLRLKSIIEALEAGESIFIILDEILKGTNSNDKLTGSFSLMKKLIKFKAAGIVATHDIALGELEKEFPGNIHNFSFEVSLENDKLFYDYKLQKGSCKNLNASFLMRKMGITG